MHNNFSHHTQLFVAFYTSALDSEFTDYLYQNSDDFIMFNLVGFTVTLYEKYWLHGIYDAVCPSSSLLDPTIFVNVYSAFLASRSAVADPGEPPFSEFSARRRPNGRRRY